MQRCNVEEKNLSFIYICKEQKIILYIAFKYIKLKNVVISLEGRREKVLELRCKSNFL
jgi:hypothetical protein